MSVLNQSKGLGILLACLLISGVIFPSMQGFAAAKGGDDNKDRDGDEKKSGESKDDSKEDESEEEAEEEPLEAKVTVEEATSLVLNFLKANFGNASYTIVKIELDEGRYEFEATDGKRKFELEIDAQTGRIIEAEAEEGEEKEEVERQPKISLQEAINITKQFLVKQFGVRNYTVREVELEEGRYKIEMRDDTGGKYELEIDAATGKIIEFEGKTRELKVEVESEDEDELKVEVKEKDRDEEKKGFKVKVQKNEPKFRLEFKAKENVTKSELDLELLFDTLIEYLDNGTSTGILDANDTIVSTIDLRRLRWNVTRSEKTGVNGSITSIAIDQTGLGDGVGNITFTYHLTPATRTISVVNDTVASVKVWEVKFDIQIIGFNWTRADSSLALSGRFNTEFEVTLKEEKEVKFKSIDGITPFFSWGGKAVADGAVIDVKADVLKNRILLSYPHFNTSLIHDPRIGYLIPASLPPIEILVPTVLMIGGAVVVTILAVTSIVRARTLRKEILRLPIGAA